MALIGDVLSNLGKLSGARTDTDAMKSVLMHPEISKLDIPDDFVSGVLKGLITKEVAKNDPEVRNHYFAQWAKTGDGVLDEALAQYGLDAETAHKIKSEDGVYKRYLKLAESLKDAEAKKSAANPEDKNKANEEVRRLNAELAAAKTELSEKLSQKEKELKDKFYSQLKERDLNSFLDAYDFGLGDLPKEVKRATAKMLLEKEIENKKLKLDYDPDKTLLGLKTSEGMDAFDEKHAQLTLKDFASRVFAENKLLKVSDSSTNGQSNTPVLNPTIVSTGQKRDTSAFDAAVDKAKEVFSLAHS